MSITKETALDQITVTENGVILYREVTRIMENGVELSKTYDRSSVVPGQDLTNKPEKVKLIADVAWTPEVIAAYVASEQ